MGIRAPNHVVPEQNLVCTIGCPDTGQPSTFTILASRVQCRQNLLVVAVDMRLVAEQQSPSGQYVPDVCWGIKLRIQLRS